MKKTVPYIFLFFLLPFFMSAQENGYAYFRDSTYKQGEVTILDKKEQQIKFEIKAKNISLFLTPENVFSWGTKKINIKKGRQYFSKNIDGDSVFLTEVMKGNYTAYSWLGKKGTWLIETPEKELLQLSDTSEVYKKAFDYFFNIKRTLILRKKSYEKRLNFAKNLTYFLNKEKQVFFPLKYWKLNFGYGISNMEFRSIEFPLNEFLSKNKKINGDKYFLSAEQEWPISANGRLSAKYGGGIAFYSFDDYSETPSAIHAMDMNVAYISGHSALKFASLKGRVLTYMDFTVFYSRKIMEDSKVFRYDISDQEFASNFYDKKIGADYLWGPVVYYGADIPFRNRIYSVAAGYAIEISNTFLKHNMRTFQFKISSML